MAFLGRSFSHWVFGLAALGLALVADGPNAAASSKPPPRGPLLPFEKVGLAFNDHVARIPANRIVRVVTRDGTFGNQVLLTNDLMVYFPDGAIVTSEFRDRLPKRLVVSGTSKKFETALGHVCASQNFSDGSRMEIRKSPRHVYSVLRYGSSQWDPMVREEMQEVAAVSATELKYLVNDPKAAQLLTQCREHVATK